MRLDPNKLSTHGFNASGPKNSTPAPMDSRGSTELWWPSTPPDPELAKMLELVKKSGLRRAVLESSDGAAGPGPMTSRCHGTP
jgi:hypothetical protein